MKKIVFIVIVIAAFLHYKKIDLPSKLGLKESEFELNSPSSSFSCDGREYCSQMTSCEEATYFINNCPNTKMDGDRDGVPCESQWC
jgi:hypothetical protein